MDEEIKTNGESEPVAEMSQQNETTDPFTMVDPINVPEPSEVEAPVEENSSSEQTDFSEPAEEQVVEINEPIIVPAPVGPQSFDMVQPTPAPAAVETVESIKPVEAIAPVSPVVKPKKHVMKTIMLILVVLVLAAAAAGAAYMYRDSVASSSEKQKTDDIAALNTKVTSLTEKLDAEIAKNTPVVDQTPTSVKPGVAAIANIKASITSGNTAALEGYMATSVNVIIAASEGVGASTPAVAVSNITTFISDATAPWNFDIAASTLSSYGQGSYKQYFPSTALVGKSANNKVISFGFDASTKINTVFLSSSDSLLE